MIVLASSSPRRAMLLRDWGYEIKIVQALVDESLPPDQSPEHGVQILAERKAKAGLKRWQETGGNQEDIIIGSDTMVVYQGIALGKPADAGEAIEMLRCLSGKQHTVMTGVALIKIGGEEVSGVIKTNVIFKELDLGTIKAYVATGEPFDKAGGYGIQGEAGKFVRSYDGSLSNVIGLPMEFVSERLRAWGIHHVNVTPREVDNELSQVKRFTGGTASS